MQVKTLYYLPITQQEIACGNAAEPGSCPVALAIYNALPQGEQVSVGTDKVDVYFTNVGYQTLLLSDEGRSFVYRFDTGLSVEPFWLLLEEVA